MGLWDSLQCRLGHRQKETQKVIIYSPIVRQMPHAGENEPFLARSLRMCARKTSNYAKNTTNDFWPSHKHLCFISRFTRVHHELWSVTVQVVIATDSSVSSVLLQPLTFPAHKTRRSLASLAKRLFPAVWEETLVPRGETQENTGHTTQPPHNQAPSSWTGLCCLPPTPTALSTDCSLCVIADF